MPVAKSTLLRRELEAIAGKPNWSRYKRSEGQNFKLYFWWVTTRGARAGNKHCLLVLKDKATDMGLDAQMCKVLSKRNWTWLELETAPCSQERADCVCVWIPY